GRPLGRTVGPRRRSRLPCLLGVRLCPRRDHPGRWRMAGAMKQALALALLAAGCVTAPAPKPPMQVVMIGDSTAAPYGPERAPQLGWAQVLPCALDANAAVVDDAKGGRSTRTFQSEGWWEKSRDKLKPGDVLLIQFGHNDESADKPERYIEARPGFA